MIILLLSALLTSLFRFDLFLEFLRLALILRFFMFIHTANIVINIFVISIDTITFLLLLIFLLLLLSLLGKEVELFILRH